jgi:propionyl-CoA carboxylase alpha subunit
LFPGSPRTTAVWEQAAGADDGIARPRLAAVSSAWPPDGQAVAVPGVVVAVLVKPGDRVAVGQPLVVLEAMKMEHPALATSDGVIDQVPVDIGQYVEAHARLVILSVPHRS